MSDHDDAQPAYDPIAASQIKGQCARCDNSFTLADMVNHLIDDHGVDPASMSVDVGQKLSEAPDASRDSMEIVRLFMEHRPPNHDFICGAMVGCYVDEAVPEAFAAHTQVVGDQRIDLKDAATLLAAALAEKYAEILSPDEVRAIFQKALDSL